MPTPTITTPRFHLTNITTPDTRPEDIWYATFDIKRGPLLTQNVQLAYVWDTPAAALSQRPLYEQALKTPLQVTGTLQNPKSDANHLAALDRIANGEFAMSVRPSQQIEALRQIARDALAAIPKRQLTHPPIDKDDQPEIKTITIRRLDLQFDADRVTAGTKEAQAEQAIALINQILERQPIGLSAQLFDHPDEIEITSNY